MFFLRQLEKERERLLDLKELGEGTTAIEEKLAALPRPTVFERDSKCGGLWQSKSMAPPTKTTTTTTTASENDENDETTESEPEGMYDGMWINAPKEIFELEDYTFDQHFQKPMPSYITRQQVLGYLEGATRDVIDEYTENGSILFDTEVAWINFDKTTNLFNVEYVPSGTPFDVEDEDFSEYADALTFDKVILATGHDNVPNIPERELHMLKEAKDTQYLFDKPVLHSSNIKSLGENIAGKNFLFIGAAYSAEDLALSFIKRGANHIYVTTRTDNGYPVTNTAYWPMNKVTVFLRTEIKEVLEDNKLRMGRRELPTPAIERLVEKYYNSSQIDFVLEDIDAVVFCTGYDIDEAVLDDQLYGYYEYDGEIYNPDARSNLDPSALTNLYDPSVFDPNNGKPMPSETELHSCGNPVHNHSETLIVDPDKDFYYDRIGTYQNALITNPGFFHHHTIYETPLLNLDIQSAYILKVITGEIPMPSTKEERYLKRAERMAEFIKHSSHVRYLDDPVYADAIDESAYEVDWYRPYDTAYSFFQMFREARVAGHSTGSFLVEIDPDDPKSAPKDASGPGCWDMANFRFEYDGITYAFSEQGLIFMAIQVAHMESHTEIAEGSLETFRDKHYKEYQSVYTGTKTVPFSKLWMEVDDILGDVGVTADVVLVEDSFEKGTGETPNKTDAADDIAATVVIDPAAPETQSFASSEL